MALAGISAGVWFGIRKYRSRWRLVDVKGDFTLEHHLPDQVPVPNAESSRVGQGEFALDEAVGWMTAFVRSHPRHRMAGQYRCVVRKYDLYQQLGDKMGRGMWHDVDVLGQRLAEVDPLDPSASVARGRAMREMGNFPRAIRFYQQALKLTPFHSAAFPEMAATCRAIGQPGRFRTALEKARQELGETHPLTIEGRIQLGELVRVYADPIDAATLAHIPREQYVQTVQWRLDEMTLDPTTALQIGQAMLGDDMPELAEDIVSRCEADYGQSSEVLLLQALIAHYRLNHQQAEDLVRRSLEVEETAMGRLELGRILIERSMQIASPAKRQKLDEAGRKELRLAIDRNPQIVEAIGLLVEPGWKKGLAGVVEELQPLIKAYPTSWAVWRVLGDAYHAEGELDRAIESYQRGVECEMHDAILLPYLNVLEQGKRRSEMLALIKSIPDLRERDPHLCWKAAQILCESQRLTDARKLLQSIVDDEQVVPHLRQRANDVLDHLDDIEREQFKDSKRKKRRRKGK